MNKFAILTAMGILVGLGLTPKAHGQLLGPLEYLCFDTATTTATGDCANKDSPFKDVVFSYLHRDDFEDQKINTPGVTAVASCTGHPAAIGCPFASVLRFPAFATDSVDEDDGAIDGSGAAGQAMWSLGNPGIEFSFDADDLGGSLPTHAGIVWTDGSGTWTFEAFDAAGGSMGTVTAALGDGVFLGATADDRFFGAINPDGISKIKIGNPNSGGGIEVDHLQYGRAVEETGPSCRFDPRNTLVPFHLSLHHVIDPDRFRHLVTVEVSLNGVPPADPVDITLSASQPIFGGPSDTPAAMATVTTDAKGKASFEFTPVPSDTLDETDFSASGSVDGTPFACEGSVVVGTLPLEVSEDAADAVALLGPLLRAVDVNQEYGARYEEFSREIAQVMFENRSRLSGLRDKLLHYRPVIGAVANAQPATLTRADLEEIHRALDFLELKASRGLRNAINRLRGYLRSPDLLASFGITVEDAAPKQQRRSPWREIQPEKYQPPRMKRRASAGSELQPDYGKLALSFEANQGQTDSQVRYLARGPGYNLYLTTREAVLVSRTPVLSTTSKNTAVRMRFVAGHARPRLTGTDELPSKSHYLIGNDPRGWHTDVQHFGKVRYENVYPGVDVVYYGRHGQLEYDIIVAAGADPRGITLAFEGAERLAKDEQGDLVLDTSAGKLRLRRPFVYQEVEGARKQIAGDYRLKGKDHIAFQIGPYDPSRPLIIDPVLSYSTYLGGTGGEAATHIAVDTNGSTYITGGTTSANLPTEGSLGSGFAGGNFLMSDGFVTKLNAEGSALVYSTYFGGTDDDMGLGIAVDAAGSAHVAGFTRSSDFPVAAPAQPAFAGGGFVFGSDAFVLKLNPAGSALTYSTYLGGAADESAAAVALDSGGNSYVTGFTTSTDFPVTGPLQPANNGGEKLGSDAFVAKLSADGSQVVYATYLGGSSDDAGNGIAVDGGGSVYLTGVTYSADFPTANPFQGLSGGSSDAFATKLNSAGSALIYSTYLGGESDDIGFSIAVDAENSAYLTGGTGSLDFPLAGAAQPDFGSVDGLSFDAFVTKVNGDGSALVYSSYLGGSGAEFGFALAVDSMGNAYVTGNTSSTDFPAANALQANNAGSVDGFLAKLAADGSTLEYATYLGGSEADDAVGIGLDPSVNVYVAGSTRSPDSPVTFGAFQTTVGGGKDVFVAKIVEGDPLPKITTVSAASFSGELGAAPESIAAGFGPGLATGTVGSPAIPLPTSLGGTLVRVTDSAGTEHLAELFLVSPLEINYLIPEDAAPGLALVIVETDGQEVARGTVRIHAVAPSLFTANVSGQGVAAALALHVARRPHPDNPAHL